MLGLRTSNFQGATVRLIVPRHIFTYNLYLPTAMFIAQVLVGLSKQLKQMTQIEHNIVKNPNWPEANQMAIYKRGQGLELGVTEKQIQVVVRAAILDRIKWNNYPPPPQRNDEGAKEQKRAILASLKWREGWSRCSIYFVQD